MPSMTERQAAAWPGAVAELNRHADDTIPADLWRWNLSWQDETRPGRGHALSATYADGEYFCQIVMDVYGGPSVSIAKTLWLHASEDDDCRCGHNEQNDFEFLQVRPGTGNLIHALSMIEPREISGIFIQAETLCGVNGRDAGGGRGLQLVHDTRGRPVEFRTDNAHPPTQNKRGQMLNVTCPRCLATLRRINRERRRAAQLAYVEERIRTELGMQERDAVGR